LGRLTVLVVLYLKGCLIILTAIEHSEDSYLVSIRVERDCNALPVARYAETGSDIIALNARWGRVCRLSQYVTMELVKGRATSGDAAVAM
jgi:hypothetical protein